MLKIMKLLVEGVTSRVADHIWGGCGPPSEYTQSVYVLYLENHNFLAFKFQTISTEYNLKAKKFCILPGGGPPRQRVVDSLEKKIVIRHLELVIFFLDIGIVFFIYWDWLFLCFLDRLNLLNQFTMQKLKNWVYSGQI